MHEVAEGIHRLGSKAHNFYIVTEGGRATVVDAGCSKEWPSVVAGLSSLGLGLSDVEALVITHGHSDHVGGARAASNDGVRVAVHEAEAPRVRHEVDGHAVTLKELPLWKPATWRFLLPLVRAGITKSPRLITVDTFGDGEVLDLPGGFVGIHTPGHTEGHAAFHLPDRGVLFTGDALVTMDLIGPGRGPQLLRDMFHTDPVEARESLDRILGLEATLLLPGHGDPWQGSPSDAVGAALRY